MKKANKLLSLLLTVVMLVQLIQVPLSASAVEYIAENETESVTDSFTLPDEYIDGVYSESNNTASKIIEEDPELREENVKHFRCENGSYIAASYPYPVHYEKDGVWKDIDNTLVPVSSYALDETDALNAPAYFTNGGLFEAAFPNVLSENSGITIQFGDTPLQMGMLSSSSEEGQVQQHTEVVTRSSEKSNLDFLRLDNLTSRIVYPDALPDTDVEYIVTPTGMKENIIIKKAQETYSYEYFISNENISLILNEDKSVNAFNEDGQLLYTIESPYMYDSMGEESYEIAVDLIEEADGYRLTYKDSLSRQQDNSVPV